MLDRQPAQRFPRSSLFPSLPSARLSLRHSLSRKRRRGATQLQPAVPLTPIPEVASREVTPTPPEETTATATSSSAYTSAFNSGVMTGCSTTATSAQGAAATSPTELDDAAASSPPISPLSPTGLEVASSSRNQTQPQTPSPPVSPAAWWLNLPYPTATTTPLPILNAESTPWDPRANWRSSYVPVLKAWETYLARHIGAFSPGSSLSLSLHIPATPPPGQQEAEGPAAAPRLPSPFSPVSSTPAPLMADEDIRWSSTGSPLPPRVPAKDQYTFPPAPPAPLIPEPGLEVSEPPPLHQHQLHHAGPSRWPFPQAPSPSLPGDWPPSPTPSEPPSQRSSPVEPLSPFPTPPATPSPPPAVQPTTTVPSYDLDLPEVVPLEQGAGGGGGLHVAFAASPSTGPSSSPTGRARVRVRRASSFPPTLPLPPHHPAAGMYIPSSRSPSPSGHRSRKKGGRGKGPVTAVRVKRTTWEKVRGRVGCRLHWRWGEGRVGGGGEWDYETSPREEEKGPGGKGKGGLGRVWAALGG